MVVTKKFKIPIHPARKREEIRYTKVLNGIEKE